MGDMTVTMDRKNHSDHRRYSFWARDSCISKPLRSWEKKQNIEMRVSHKTGSESHLGGGTFGSLMKHAIENGIRVKEN